MSLAGFDTLLREHPDQGALIVRLEGAFRDILSEDPRAALDEHYLATVARVPLRDVEAWLIELMRAGMLEYRVAWKCPRTQGPVREVRELSDLPMSIECDKCGDVHEYDPEQVEIFFIATDRLIRSIPH